MITLRKAAAGGIAAATIALTLLSGGVAFAQTTTTSYSSGTTGASSTPSTPNTGAGGDALTTSLELGGLVLVGGGAAFYLARRRAKEV